MIIFENEYTIKEKTAVTMGKFDGIHEGHRKLIEKTVSLAKQNRLKSLIYIFNQNPKNVLNGERIQSLTSKNEKIEILREIGVDYIVFQDFTYEFSQILPDEFVKQVIKDKLNAREVVVGFNHRFGKDAEGDINTLKVLSEKMDFKVHIIEPVIKDGEIISSSMLREQAKV